MLETTLSGSARIPTASGLFAIAVVYGNYHIKILTSYTNEHCAHD